MCDGRGNLAAPNNGKVGEEIIGEISSDVCERIPVEEQEGCPAVAGTQEIKCFDQ